MAGLCEGWHQIEFLPDGVRLIEPPGIDVVRPTTKDLALGLLAHHGTPIELERWAAVLLAMNHVDLGALEDEPDGEWVLETLWDAANGQVPSVGSYGGLSRLVYRP